MIRVKAGFNPDILSEYKVRSFLLDTFSETAYCGTGETFDWSIAEAAARSYRIILAGGLDPDTIAGAVEAVRPYAVDISSGVEKEPGIKDHNKLEGLFKALGRTGPNSKSF